MRSCKAFVPEELLKMGEAALDSRSDHYRPRSPQTSQYYRCIEDHFEAFEQVYDERFSYQYGFFRPYVKDVIYRYLDCGILHNGFARVKCPDCNHEYLLAFVLERSGNPAASGTSLKEFPGFHDEQLKGRRKGQRSSRLNIQYRVKYEVEEHEITVYVIEISPHDD